MYVRGVLSITAFVFAFAAHSANVCELAFQGDDVHVAPTGWGYAARLHPLDNQNIFTGLAAGERAWINVQLKPGAGGFASSSTRKLEGWFRGPVSVEVREASGSGSSQTFRGRFGRHEMNFITYGDADGNARLYGLIMPAREFSYLRSTWIDATPQPGPWRKVVGQIENVRFDLQETDFISGMAWVYGQAWIGDRQERVEIRLLDRSSSQAGFMMNGLFGPLSHSVDGRRPRLDLAWFALWALSLADRTR